MSADLVSVIIPIYNVENYLKRCIDSVLAQTYQNLEIILVDDGSTDGSARICDIYLHEDSRIRVIHQLNGGLSAARNTGIDAAHGKYLSFIDADDFIHPQMIECLYQGICLNEAMVSICGFMKAWDSTTVTEKVYSFSKKNYRVLKCEELYHWYFESDEGHITVISACNKLFHKSIFEQVRFYVGKLYEDMYVMFQLLKNADRICYCGERLYFYFQREDSICHNQENEVRKWKAYQGAMYAIHDFIKTTDNKELIYLSINEMLKWAYIISRRKEVWDNKDISAYVRKLYNKAYRDFKKDIKRIGWRIRYALMRYIPRGYNIALNFMKRQCGVNNEKS